MTSPASIVLPRPTSCQQFYRVWLQQQDVVLNVLNTVIYHQPVQTIVTADALCYLATAAKIANVQQEDTLLAPIESNVILCRTS